MLPYFAFVRKTAFLEQIVTLNIFPRKITVLHNLTLPSKHSTLFLFLPVYSPPDTLSSTVPLCFRILYIPLCPGCCVAVFLMPLHFCVPLKSSNPHTPVAAGSDRRVMCNNHHGAVCSRAADVVNDLGDMSGIDTGKGFIYSAFPLRHHPSGRLDFLCSACRQSSFASSKDSSSNRISNICLIFS